MSARWARYRGLLGPYLVAAALGYLLGSRSVSAFDAVLGADVPAAASRVGLALREGPQAPVQAQLASGADLRAVAASLPSPRREVFDLVVAVRGLHDGGKSDWTRAEQTCRALAWPRCDRVSLEQLKQQSVP